MRTTRELFVFVALTVALTVAIVVPLTVAAAVASIVVGATGMGRSAGNLSAAENAPASAARCSCCDCRCDGGKEKCGPTVCPTIQ